MDGALSKLSQEQYQILIPQLMAGRLCFFDDIGANDFYYTVDQNDEVANPLGGVGTEVTDTAIFLVIHTTHDDGI